MDQKELLEEHNPLLVILPQDFARPRPWRRWLWQPAKVRRGDFHPCSAELFLSHVSISEEGRKPETPWNWDGTLTDLTALRQRLREVGADSTLDWHMDVWPIRSQRPASAWPTYRRMVEQYPVPFVPTVYGRCVEYGDRLALQYWYLSVYNDAANYHEGDWEMVAIELDGQGRPVRAGYSGHASGFQRPWERVQKRGKRPVVYIGRGSHAAYFEHRKKGHRTNSLESPKGQPWLVEQISLRLQRAFQRLLRFLRWQDRTPAHPDLGADEEWSRGELLSPRVAILRRLDEVDTDDCWWMALRCRWGSSHKRWLGTAAPNPPWEQTAKWDDPLAWMDTLEK